MRYHALATDYDGTLATDGTVDESTIAALEELRRTGRRLLLVTGRELEDLQRVFSRLELFDLVVAENGAVVYQPETRNVRLLGEKPVESFIEGLRRRQVTPLSVGHVIVATWQPMETRVMETIRDLGLELQIIFNKGAVMILPSGINKASGLRAALKELSISPHNVIGIGDAENDHAFLSACACAVAVSNSVEMLKQKADYVTTTDHGAGVEELIEMVIASDLQEFQPALKRHDLTIGSMPEGEPVQLPAYGSNILVTGASGGGKTTLALTFLERLQEQDYQYCIVDPEGDYVELPETTVFGDMDTPPNIAEVVDLLQQTGQDAALNLLAISFEDRPSFFQTLFPAVQELRAKFGHPHWLIVDEVHHLIPAGWNATSTLIPQEAHGLFFITVHPEKISHDALINVDVIVGLGSTALETLETFAAKLQRTIQMKDVPPPKNGQAVIWCISGDEAPKTFDILPPRTEQKRHVRKYAVGQLGPDASFYFKGPDGKLNLRAHNLTMFLQIADGVDDETWTFHLKQGDISRWFSERIKDQDIAAQIRQIEGQDLPAQQSRIKIRSLIEERYTAPA